MPSATGFCLFETSIGHCALAWNGNGVAGCMLPGVDEAATRRRMERSYPEAREAPAPDAIQAVAARVRALLDGEPDALLDVVLDMADVPQFQQDVYRITRGIPPGRTLTYGDVAKALGDPGAARAVGQALGHNPYAPIVPCHRVLAANTGAGGFSAEGGVATKLRMLQIEKAQLGPQPGLFD